jgi:hypothetical protein
LHRLGSPQASLWRDLLTSKTPILSGPRKRFATELLSRIPRYGDLVNFHEFPAKLVDRLCEFLQRFLF